MRIGVVNLGCERLVVIVAHPLITVERDNLNRGFLIEHLGGLRAWIV